MIPRKISTPSARQVGGRSDADDRTTKDVERDHLARSGRRKQCRGDQRRRAAGEHRSKLKADRRAAVAQARGETFRGQRRQRSPLLPDDDTLEAIFQEFRSKLRAVCTLSDKDPVVVFPKLGEIRPE